MVYKQFSLPVLGYLFNDHNNVTLLSPTNQDIEKLLHTHIKAEETLKLGVTQYEIQFQNFITILIPPKVVQFITIL